MRPRDALFYCVFVLAAAGCDGQGDDDTQTIETPTSGVSPDPTTPCPPVETSPPATGTPAETSAPPTDTPVGSPDPTVTPGTPDVTSTPTDTPATETPVAPCLTPTPDTPTPVSPTPGSPTPIPAYGLEARVPNTTCAMPETPVSPGAMKLEPAFPGLSFYYPVFLTHAGDGSDRIFVLEQVGTIRVFDNGASGTPSLFLDIRDRVVFSGEMGLLGLVFHPDFARNGYFYVNYTTGLSDTDRRTIVSRFQVDPTDPNRVDPSTELKIIEIAQPFSNHNGGMIAFGPDGYLYIGMGDGGSGGDPLNSGQDRTTLLGKFLRIDVDHSNAERNYAVPSDNPFVKATDGSRPEIWAYGFRNPWRFSFDRVTGQLWAADVGQAQWEEIDIVERGGNYGWRLMEGTHCYYPSTGCDTGNLTMPVHEYSHADGLSITGGYVYRGSRLPELYGRYVYADFANGRIWALQWNGTELVDNLELVDSGEYVSSFGEDEAGELYVVGIYSGQIFRLARAAATASMASLPSTLTATGCFADVPGRVPAGGVLPYDVNAPLWSDGAYKDRWLALPGDSRIGFAEEGPWSFPDGTVTLKDFYIEEEVGNPITKRLLETRLMVKHAGSWQGYVYKWNEAQTEAYLIDGSLTESYPVILPDGSSARVEHYYPSRSDCQSCHTLSAGFALGLQTGQLNRDFDYGAVVDNQLRTFDHIGLFDVPVSGPYDTYPAWADPADDAAPLEARARSYLASNCASCHLPGGTAVSTLDLRFETALAEMHACGEAPLQGDLGMEEPLLIAPGEPDRSVLALRMHLLDDARMPPLASSVVDPLGTSVIDAWISELPGCP